MLERIIKNVDLLNEALGEMNRSVADINQHNQDITIVAEMWNGYHRNVDSVSYTHLTLPTICSV